MKILLNCDLGEGEEATTTASLLEVVDLANIACGGHAGDEATMRAVVREAVVRGVQPGAHPGWADRESFGRTRAAVGTAELRHLMAEQVGLLQRMIKEEGGQLGHVKLHGALYHLCDEREDLAEACVDWMYAEMEGVALIVGAGGLLHAVAEARGVSVLREVFAERGYAEESRLVPRGEEGALLDDPTFVAQRVREWRRTGYWPLRSGRQWMVEAETVGLHADSPASVAIARAVKDVLATGGDAEQAEG